MHYNLREVFAFGDSYRIFGMVHHFDPEVSGVSAIYNSRMQQQRLLETKRTT